MKPWFVAALLVICVTSVAARPQDVPRFSSGVQVVEVYATVTDANGPVTGLAREDFELFEDGQKQPVETFAAGEFPLTVALGIDRSFSMAGEKLRLAKQASRSFLNGLRPRDRSMVVAIGNEAEIIAPLSADRPGQLVALERVDAWSTTALYDAIAVSLDRLEPEPGRQALVIFSDGQDRYSRTSAANVLDRAKRSRALIYPVVIGGTRSAAAVELATASGGRTFQLKDARELEPTLQAIAGELRYQYLLGYVPPASAAEAARWRSIRVALKSPRPGVRIRARDGYFSD